MPINGTESSEDKKSDLSEHVHIEKNNDELILAASKIQRSWRKHKNKKDKKRTEKGLDSEKMLQTSEENNDKDNKGNQQEGCNHAEGKKNDQRRNREGSDFQEASVVSIGSSSSTCEQEKRPNILKFRGNHTKEVQSCESVDAAGLASMESRSLMEGKTGMQAPCKLLEESTSTDRTTSPDYEHEVLFV